MRIHLDTSAYVKGFNEEARSDVIEDIFDKCEQKRLEIVTSWWTISESIAALDQAFRKKGIILKPQRNAAISSLLGKTSDLSKQESLILVEMNEKIIVASWEIIRRMHLSADDALHLFTAKVGKCDLMVVADNYFWERFKTEPDIEEHEDIGEEIRFPFDVYNILIDEDYQLLKSKIAAL